MSDLDDNDDIDDGDDDDKDNDDGDAYDDLVQVMAHCWARQPRARPSFPHLAGSPSFMIVAFDMIWLVLHPC